MSLKFLLDENVRIELYRFLNSEGLDVQYAPKSTKDSKIALISKQEKSILVTNDEDFTECGTDDVFSIVWLRISQNEPKTLISSFVKLSKEFKNFKGKLVILIPNDWNVVNLWIDVQTEQD